MKNVMISVNPKWCEKFCGKATAADCWMRYFQLKYNEKEDTNE